MWFQQLRAMIDLLAEHSFTLIQIPSHVDVLRTLAGKHEDNCLIRRRADRLEHMLWFQSLVDRATHDRAAMVKSLSSNLQRVSDVREVGFRMSMEIFGKVGRRLVQG